MSRPATGGRRTTKTEYIETDTGNKISRRAHIEGKQNIMLGGKSVIMAGVTLRGDLHRLQPASTATTTSTPNSSTTDSAPVPAPRTTPITAIAIGKCTIISTSSTLHPPSRISSGEATYYPMRIGDHVFIGAGTTVRSVSIASHVHVGAGCVLGPFSMLKDSCRVVAGSVVPAGMVVPAGAVVAGRPARVVGMVGDGFGVGGGGLGGEDGEVVEGGDMRGLVRSIK